MHPLNVIAAVNRIVSPAYLVGGAVRDAVVSYEVKDWDFATPLTPDEVEAAAKAAGRRVYTMGKRFGTIGFKVEVDGEFVMVEVTTFRAETYAEGSRKPDVAFTNDLSLDLSRRDFTINAMAMRPDGRLIDPYGGFRELVTGGSIKAVGHPTHRFKEDPLRMLRACRFAGQFHMAIDPDTLGSMRRNAYRITSVSRERWMQELDKMLMLTTPSIALSWLYEGGLLAFMLPELHQQVGYEQNSKYHSLPLWEHTLAVVDGVPADLDLRWAALLHDIGKPATCRQNPNSGYNNFVHHERVGAELVSGIALRLKWSLDRTKAVVRLVRYHLDDTSPLKAADDAAKAA